MLNTPLQGLSKKAVGLGRATQNHREFRTNFMGSRQVHELKMWAGS